MGTGVETGCYGVEVGMLAQRAGDGGPIPVCNASNFLYLDSIAGICNVTHLMVHLLIAI